MPTEGALTSQSLMKCHVTVDSGDGIVSWEQQEQECQTNAFVGIDVIQFFQAGWMTTILQWKMVKFPEGSAFPSCPMAVADSYWTSPWSTVGLITFTVLLHHRNVQGATVVQTKCKEKKLLPVHFNASEDLLHCFIISWLRTCKIKFLCEFIWYRQSAADTHSPFMTVKFKPF